MRQQYKGWEINENPVSGVVIITKPYDEPVVYPNATFTHAIKTFAAINRDLVAQAKGRIDELERKSIS